MNDVMKKRLIGVVILVAIGILVPTLLSRCMGNSDNSGSSSDDMRVYEVQPDGNATRADQTSDDDTAGEASNSNKPASQPRMPDAMSPQREHDDTSGQQKSFTPPPVHGNQNEDDDSDSGSRDRESDASDEAPTRSTPRAERSEPAPSRRGGSDYGASTLGGSGSAGSSSSSASASAEKNVSGWVVQVGSFSQQANARDLSRQLGNDFDTTYSAVQVGGRTLYHVYVGPFSAESAARSAASKLESQGKNGFVRHLP